MIGWVSTYTAVISTSPAETTGEHCEIEVLENEGEVGPILGLFDRGKILATCTSDRAVLWVQLPQLVSSDIDITDVMVSADGVLAASGWSRTEDWVAAYSSFYAMVKREVPVTKGKGMSWR